MHNTLTPSQVLTSAHKAWKASGSKELFAVWLSAEQADGRFWGG